MTTPTTVKVRNGDLKVGDWIWVRGQKVRVVENPAEIGLNPNYVIVRVQNMKGERWLESMVRHRKRKRVAL